VAEEFFWRGFFLRWFQARAFLGVDPRRIGAAAFWIVVALFAVEHSRWLAGALAGAAYGWFYVRTGDLRATAAAHAVTNLLLGLYVLAFGAYRFW
jgi:CAAX prenyl protease-like protein